MANPPRENDHGADPSGLKEESEARPGAYVEMVSTPRRRRSSGSLAPEGGAQPFHVAHATEQIRLPSGAVAYVSQPVPRAHGAHGPIGMSGAPHTAYGSSGPPPRSEEVALDRGEESRPSAYGAPKAITEVMMPAREDARAEVANSNRRADLARIPSVPPAAAVPASMPPPRKSEPPAASVLDAKPQFHSDPPAVKQTSWGLLIAVSVLSAIIAAALVVFVIESRAAKNKEERTDQATASAEPSATPREPAASQLEAVIATKSPEPQVLGEAKNVPVVAAAIQNTPAPAKAQVSPAPPVEAARPKAVVRPSSPRPPLPAEEQARPVEAEITAPANETAEAQPAALVEEKSVPEPAVAADSSEKAAQVEAPSALPEHIPENPF